MRRLRQVLSLHVLMQGFVGILGGVVRLRLVRVPVVAGVVWRWWIVV